MLTVEYLYKRFDYKNGNLYKKGGLKPLLASIDGYRVVRIGTKMCKMHRIIFMMHHGYMPKIVDHIDGNTFNNKITNLREATQTENAQNRKIDKTNKSGFKNVNWHKKSQKWVVQISSFNKKIHVGLFDDVELADLVAQEARNKFHKSFANHG